MSAWWELLGALNTAAMVRAFRPTFCRLLVEEFAPAWWLR